MIMTLRRADATVGPRRVIPRVLRQLDPTGLHLVREGRRWPAYNLEGLLGPAPPARPGLGPNLQREAAAAGHTSATEALRVLEDEHSMCDLPLPRSGIAAA